MQTLSSLLKKLLGLLVVVGLAFVLVNFWSYIFSRTVVGRIDNVARVTGVTAMIGTRQLTDGQLHMFSVSIRQPNGEMVTAISEDGQWAIARNGLCVKAKYYPHPPWDLKNAGTYFNARLLTMVDCDSQAARDIGIDPTSFNSAPPVVPSTPKPEGERPSQEMPNAPEGLGEAPSFPAQ